MKKFAVSLGGISLSFTLSCGTQTTTGNMAQVNSTNQTNKILYTMTNTKDVESLWNSLNLPVGIIDQEFAVKEFSASRSEATLLCKYTHKPSTAESRRGSCEFSVNQEKNGQYFTDESSSKILYEAMGAPTPSRSGQVKFFESSDKKIQIYCGYQNTPIFPYKYFCWFKITP